MVQVSFIHVNLIVSFVTCELNFSFVSCMFKKKSELNSIIKQIMPRIHFRHYSKTKVACISLSIVLIYWICFKSKRYTETFELTLQEPNSIESKLLWEFIADFSNHPKLNPTITQFEILYEKGNYENWEYGVNFEQDSLVFPAFVHYKNYAVFKILPEIQESFQHMKKRKENSLFNIHEPAKILSNFTTCMLGYCIESGSEMTFVTTSNSNNPSGNSQHGQNSVKSTKIFEKFHFDCSPIVSLLYFNEIYRQKKLVFENIESSIDMFALP